MINKLIPEERILKQNIYYYLALILWPVYLLLLPAILVYGRLWALPFMIFPGLFLFTWLGYLMHESWHKYVPSVNNRFFYNSFAMMILSDPQLYNMTHSTHHVQIHTWQDAEFHPLGEIKSRGLRIVYNWLEILLGVAFLEVVASVKIPGDKRFAEKYRAWKLFASAGVWISFLGIIGYLSHLIFGVTLPQTLMSYALTYWFGSFLLHQSQLVEHGNLIMDGAIRERNLQTRNLKPKGIIEKTFLFLTHNDSCEHILHHTMTVIHSRPFPGEIDLPKDAVYITMSDHFRILWRMLKGEVDHHNSIRKH
jgi:fatty acid desaturase